MTSSRYCPLPPFSACSMWAGGGGYVIKMPLGMTQANLMIILGIKKVTQEVFPCSQPLRSSLLFPSLAISFIFCKTTYCLSSHTEIYNCSAPQLNPTVASGKKISIHDYLTNKLTNEYMSLRVNGIVITARKKSKTIWKFAKSRIMTSMLVELS